MTKKAQREFGELGQQVLKQREVGDPYKVNPDRRGKRPVKVEDTRQIALRSLHSDFGIQDALLPAISVAIETANEVSEILDSGGTWEEARQAGIQTNEFWQKETQRIRDANIEVFTKLSKEKSAGAIHLMTIATGGDTVIDSVLAFCGFGTDAVREVVRNLKTKLKLQAS